MSLPESHRYRLLVHTSDVTRGQLVHLPWDYDHYGLDRDAQDVVHAVRASMSIPFFFEPVTVAAQPAEVDVPSPGRWLHRHPLRRRHGDLGGRGHAAELPHQRVRRARTAGRPAGPPSASSCRRSRRSTRPPRPRTAPSARPGLPAHHDGRVGRLQRRRRHRRAHHLRGQRRDLDHGLRPDDGAAPRALPQRRHGRDRLRHGDGCPRRGPAQRDRGAPARGSEAARAAVGEPERRRGRRSGGRCRRAQRSAGRRARRPGRARTRSTSASNPASASQPSWSASGGGPVVAVGDRGHRVGRVERDDQVAEHEAAAGAQRRRRSGRTGRPCPAPPGGGRRGPRRRGRRGRRAAGRSGRRPAGRAGRPARRSRAAPSMASLLSTPTAAAPGGAPARRPASPPSRSRDRAATPPPARAVAAATASCSRP